MYFINTKTYVITEKEFKEKIGLKENEKINFINFYDKKIKIEVEIYENNSNL